MTTSLTRAQWHSWLPWLLVLCVISLLQLAGTYPHGRLNLPAADLHWVWTGLTCHLLHITFQHYLYNALGLVVIAALFVGVYTWQSCLLTYCLSALTISVGLIWFPAGLHNYAGLSGVLHGWFMMGCLLLLPQQPRLASVLFVLMLIKLVVENVNGGLLSMPGFTVATRAHLYGVTGGSLSWLCVSLWRARRRH
ncbi:MAG: rhombosortase [Gammaproteobacteria bacterium]|nr:rhombosortase [Gammaproteobacteria bacterium]